MLLSYFFKPRNLDASILNGMVTIIVMIQTTGQVVILMGVIAAIQIQILASVLHVIAFKIQFQVHIDSF